MAARIRMLTSAAVDDVVYRKGETYLVPDDIANGLLLLGAAVPGDADTAVRVRRLIEWTEAPEHTPLERPRNWIRRVG